MLDSSVKYFDSSMSGAPVLSGTAGSLINLLDAGLINGFGSVTLNSLVISGGVATGTVSGGHDFQMIVGINAVSPGVGPVILIGGATPSELNAEWRLSGATSTTFTFDVALPNQTATGTITAKRASAGWIKAFSGTNTAAYSRPSLEATDMLLSVDDTPAQYPALMMYESMTGALVGTGPAPTSNSLWLTKSSVASSTERLWRLIADDRAFYFMGKPDGANWSVASFFGDVNKYKSTDQYHCLLVSQLSKTYSVGISYLRLLGTTGAAFFSRDASQTGAAVSCARYSHQAAGSHLSFGESVYPAIDDSVHFCGVEAWQKDSIVSPRGMMPGLYSPLHTGYPLEMYLVDNIPQLPNSQLLALPMGSNSYIGLIDIMGPWR